MVLVFAAVWGVNKKIQTGDTSQTGSPQNGNSIPENKSEQETIPASVCQNCLDGTKCGELNKNNELCECDKYKTACNLSSGPVCGQCSDGTKCGSQNTDGQLCGCSNQSSDQTGVSGIKFYGICELIKTSDCDAECKKIGFSRGYCSANKKEGENTFAECDANDYPFSSGANGIVADNCSGSLSSGHSAEKICCCAGEPQNTGDCPVIEKPENSMPCFRQSGYLKNPVTGDCCWYREPCHEPEGWLFFGSKQACLSAE